jgi:hypothetical protein
MKRKQSNIIALLIETTLILSHTDIIFMMSVDIDIILVSIDDGL